MSIAHRVAEAIDKMVAGDPEGALIPTSIAIDATATKTYGRRGKQSFKRFIADNLAFITKAAFGNPISENLRLGYRHPEIQSEPDGCCHIREIFYHVVRCGLLHEGALPHNLKFAADRAIRVHNGSVSLPSSLIHGLLLAVVAAPCNSAETLPDRYLIPVESTPSLNRFWGKRAELVALLYAGDTATT